MDDTDCDVLIAGGGPTGVTLAILLARLGVRVVVAEREAAIYPLPRAAHLDHEAMRILQAAGAADEVFATNCSMSDDPWVRSWQLCSMTPMALLDQFKVISLSDPNERLSLLVEICCERYGDYQRMLVVDNRSPFA